MKLIKLNIDKILYWAAIIVLAVSSGCAENILDLDLDSFERNIVIEGIISDRQGSTTVEISRIEDYFDDRVTSSISDAQVTISDDKGNSETLTPEGSGVYKSQIIGTTGNTYTMTVTVNDEIYSASSKLPDPVEIEKIESERVVWDNYDLLIHIRDRVDVEEYCRLRIYRNGYLWDELLYQDQHIDGEAVTIEISNFQRLDNVKVEVSTFSKSMYNYLIDVKELDDNSDSDAGELVQLAAGNPRTNLTNNALGYFSAQSYRVYYHIIR